MLRLSRLLWVLLLIGAFVALDNDRAEATTGLASWYGPGFEGSLTASGEVFDPNGFTAAHNTLPLGTQLLVSYGGRSVVVTVNDRGPYSGGRDLDLSQGAAEYLGLTAAGVDWVDYTVVGGGYTDDSGGAGYASGQSDTGGGSYVVQSGDTLYGIAAYLGVSADELAAANGITDPSLLTVGETLYY